MYFIKLEYNKSLKVWLNYVALEILIEYSYDVNIVFIDFSF